MAVYTVHVPAGVADDLLRADRTVFVREGFNVWAFVFGFPFLLRHRLWAALLVWFVGVALLVAFGRTLHPPGSTIVALLGLMHLFIGVEGNDLRRWRLDRRNYWLADVVFGDRRSDAERVFFVRQPQEVVDAASIPVYHPPGDGTPAVIGMFQEENGP